jgi:hypothetical protein
MVQLCENYREKCSEYLEIIPGNKIPDLLYQHKRNRMARNPIKW